MLVRKTDVPSASWQITSKVNTEWGTKISPQKLGSILTAMKKDSKLGAKAADALSLAYQQAKAKAKDNPTQQQLGAQLQTAVTSIANEHAKGRINDGYVDGREAAALKSDLAKKLYKYISTSSAFSHKATAASELNLKASQSQISQAIAKLNPVIDAGFKLYDPKNDDDGDGLAKAIRQASTDAGLSSWGRAAILTALNGASDHSDWGGNADAAGIKGLLTSAQSKLKLSDGALIVDLAHPTKTPKQKKDGITTGLELDRTPAATGMTSRALLKFASTL